MVLWERAKVQDSFLLLPTCIVPEERMLLLQVKTACMFSLMMVSDG